MKQIFLHKFLFSLIIGFIVSCSSSKINEAPLMTGPIIESSPKDFPKVSIGSPQPILDDDISIKRWVYIVEDFLIFEISKDKFFYKVFDKNTLELIGDFGVRGEGPEEWTDEITFSGQFEVSHSRPYMWISSNQKGFFGKLDILKTLENKNGYPVFEKILPVNSREFPNSFMIYINDSLFISRPHYIDNHITRIKSLSNNSIQNVSLAFPIVQNIQKLESPEIYNIYLGSVAKHPTKNILVQSMTFFNRIDFFDLQLNHLYGTVEGKNWKDNYYNATTLTKRESWFFDELDGYNTLYVSENYVYAVKVSYKNKIRASELRVFDWDGNPKAIVNVPHSIVSIAVDEKKAKMYGTSLEEERVWVFDISNLLKKL